MERLIFLGFKGKKNCVMMGVPETGWRRLNALKTVVLLFEKMGCRLPIVPNNNFFNSIYFYA